MSNAQIQLYNNFKAFTKDFKEDIGLDVNKETMSLYIQYYNARINDKTFQIVHGLTTQLLNKIDFLPSQIRTQMAEMIRDHDTIKQLLQKRP